MFCQCESAYATEPEWVESLLAYVYQSVHTVMGSPPLIFLDQAHAA